MGSRELKALIVAPANSTMMEPEIGAMCPEFTEIRMGRVPRSPGMLTLETLPVLESRTIDVLEQNLDFEPDIVFFGCTVAGFLSGPERHRAFIERLEAIAGVDVVGVAPAMIEALRVVNVSGTAVVTPYMQAANESLIRYLEAEGIDVEVLDSFYPGSIENLMKITEDDVRRKVLATVTPGSQAAFVACAQMPAMNIIPGLRRELGIPVWSSITAMAWDASRRLADQGVDIALLSNPGLAVPANMNVES